MRTWYSAYSIFILTLAFCGTAHAQDITQYTSDMASQGLQIPDSGARAWERAGDNDRKVYNHLGDEADEVVSAFERHAAMLQITNADDKMTQENEIILGDGPGSWNEAKANGVTASDYIIRTVQPALDRIGEGITNDRAREHFSEQRRSMLVGYMRSFSLDRSRLADFPPPSRSPDITSAAGSFRRFDEWQKDNGKTSRSESAR